MRFKRSDLPALLIAVGAPPLLMLLFLSAFEVWDHQGSPLLGFMAGNFAGAVGLAAIFSRFIRRWEWPLTLLGVLAAALLGIIWVQRTGNDGTAFATALKWIALGDFLLLNLAIGLQVLNNGLLPILDRRDARRASESPPQT